jgi:hypothetical protein
LVAFRAGEYSGTSEQGLGGAPKTAGKAKRPPYLPKGKESDSTNGTPKGPGAPLEAKGDHRIVIQQFHELDDLKQVRWHYLKNEIAAIETIIEKRGNQYFLLTKETFENPERDGTDGAAAKKKIIEVGAKYKAPPGYQSFAPKLFSDCYGEKIRQ